MALIEHIGFPIPQLIPSHVNQTDAYMADAVAWGRAGGIVDVGANYRAIVQLIEAGVPPGRILLSSDGNGAPPKEEKREGQPARANYMLVGALHAVSRQLVSSRACRWRMPCGW